MSGDSFSIQVPTDDEGYLGLRCPECAGPFKIRGADYESRDCGILYCANCGLPNEFGSLLPLDVVEAIHRAATEHIQPMLQQVVDEINKTPPGLVSVRAELSPLPPPSVLRAITDLAEASQDRTIAAETFAATHPGSNRKLDKDVEKVRSIDAEHRYVFFLSPVGAKRVEYEGVTVVRPDHDCLRGILSEDV